MKKKINADKCKILGEDCIVETTSLTERKSTLNIKLNGKFFVYKVDACLGKSTISKKCDYLIVNCERRELVYVELKGSDIRSACKQILTTFEVYKPVSEGFTKKAIIVSSKYDNNIVQNTDYTKIRKLFGKNLIIKNREYTYN